MFLKTYRKQESKMKISASLTEQYIAKISQEKIVGCLLYGPESTISRYRFEIIAKQIVSDLSDPFLVVNLSSERIKEDKAILVDEFYSMSMLGGRKLILIKDGNEDVVQALKILMTDPQYGRKSNNFILILAGDLAKTSGLRKIIEESQFLMALPCYEDRVESIRSFVIKEMQKNNIETNPQIIYMFIKNYGKDRHLMLNEINKIKNYLSKDEKLTPEIFDKLCTSGQDNNLYDFAIEFARKNYDQCMIMAERALEVGNESIMLTRSLINYFSKLYFAKVGLELEGRSLEEVVKSAQIFFKNEKDFKVNLQNLSLKFITKSLQSFEILELNLKKGNIPQKLVFLSYVRGYIVKKKVKTNYFKKVEITT